MTVTQFSSFTGSRRVAAIQTPIIPTIGELVRNTPECISFGQGVAYYDPPQSSFDAVKQHLFEHSTHLYGPVEGLPELQTALQEKLHKQNQIVIEPHYAMVVTAGSNMAFSSLMTVIADVGDEIILPVPYYFNHEMAIRMVDCAPVPVSTTTDFHLDLNAIEAAVTKKTRAIVTVSPNNPTGAVYTQEELEAVSELCERYGIYHISDEAYEDFVYADHSHFSPASLNGAHDHTISLYSFSKSYGFAGWRIGYIVMPKALLAAYKKVQDTILISPTVIAQQAAIGALDTGKSFVTEKLQRLDLVRRRMLDQLQPYNTLVQSARGEGAFYLFCKISCEMDDLTLATELIQNHGVALIPGSTFGCKDGCYLRLSYGAIDPDLVTEGIQRFTQGIQQIIDPN